VAFQRQHERLRQHSFELRFERQRKQVRDVLGADAAVGAWAEGQKMSLAEAIAYVQRVTAGTPAD
jgi:hypothetical protein